MPFNLKVASLLQAIFFENCALSLNAIDTWFANTELTTLLSYRLLGCFTLAASILSSKLVDIFGKTLPMSILNGFIRFVVICLKLSAALFFLSATLSCLLYHLKQSFSTQKLIIAHLVCPINYTPKIKKNTRKAMAYWIIYIFLKIIH